MKKENSTTTGPPSAISGPHAAKVHEKHYKLAKAWNCDDQNQHDLHLNTNARR
jgi:hypothetical protein